MSPRSLAQIAVPGLVVGILIATVSATNASETMSPIAPQPTGPPTSIPTARLSHIGISVTSPRGNARITSKQAEAVALSLFPGHTVGRVHVPPRQGQSPASS